MISNQDRKFISRALGVAESSTQRQKHGCIVAKNGRTLGVGVNSFRNVPTNVSSPRTDSSYHAEVMALRACVAYSLRATVYVARVDSEGRARMSKPCDICMDALRLCGVKRVVYTIDDGDIQDLRF